MIAPSVIRAYHFHSENGGWIVGEKASCVLRAAKAEIAASEMNWSFEWEWDDFADLSWMDDEERAKPHEVLACCLKNEDGEVLASLCGITDPDSNYRRVVEAELAMEADAVITLDAFQDEIASGMLAECFA